MAPKQKGILALILLSAVFACMGLFSRFLATDLMLFQQVYLRIFVAFILGLLIFNKKLNFKKLKKLTKKEWLLLVARADFMYFGTLCITQALISTKLSNVSFIGALPIVAIFGFLLKMEKLTLSKSLLILIACLGTIIVGVKDFSSLFSWGKGELLALASAILFSLSYVLRKYHSNLLNNMEITTLTFLIASLTIFVLSILKGDGLPSPTQGWNFFLLITIIFAGLFNVINVGLTNYGFKNIEVFLASNILTLEAVFALILGFLFYQEIPTVKEILGGLVIIGSVIAMNELDKKTKKIN